MDNVGIYKELEEIFSDVFFREGIKLRPERSAKDVDGWDSVKQIEIILACEERFDLRFSSREIDGLRCVGDLSNLILKKL